MSNWTITLSQKKSDRSKQRPYLLHSIKYNQPFFFLVIVDPIKEQAFLKAMQKNHTIDLASFGSIKERGFLPIPTMIQKRIGQWFE